MRRTILIFFSLLLVASAVSADVSPMSYSGMSLAPAQAGDIRMLHETVDIHVLTEGKDLPYRYTCRVSAEFRMINDGDSTITLLVGFPVQPFIGEQFKEKHINEDIYEFSVVVNGEEIGDLSTQTISGPFFGGLRDDGGAIWFGWTNVFEPGETKISVGYKILSRPNRMFDASIIDYSLYSGSLWNGTIGTAEIRVHFPVDVDDDLVKTVYPSDPHFSGRTITWTFTDFEPTFRDNVTVDFMSLSCHEDIRSARERLAEDPDNAENKIALAEAYLSTMRNSGFGSREAVRLDVLREADFENFLGSIENDAYRDMLGSSFEWKYFGDPSKCMYVRKNLSEADNEKIDDILFEERYKPFVSMRGDYCKIAEKLIREVLEESPGNAYAWNLYLSNMFKIIDRAWGPVEWSDQFAMLPYQTEMIEKAHAHCPEDEGILLWHSLLETNADIPGDENRRFIGREIAKYNKAAGIY